MVDFGCKILGRSPKTLLPAVPKIARILLAMRHIFVLFILSVVGSVIGMGAVRGAAQDSNHPRSVGNGIEIDSNGLMSPLSKEKSETFGQSIERILSPVPENLDKKVSLRKISLKKLDAEVKRIVEQRGVLPDEILYCGGLTSIDYIVAAPEENDLFIIGPAEGWRADAAGNVVGNQTGNPVLIFEDFLAILREIRLRGTNRSDGNRPIVCSIEPNQESMSKLALLYRQYPSIKADNADAFCTALEEIYGECPVQISGISPSSRFARILVAADFKMKQIALGLESSQVRTLPSYTSLVSASRPNISARFWLIPEFSETVHDSKKLTWRLGDPKIKAQSHEDYRNIRSAGTDRAAVNWCRHFEENYAALSRVQPVFGELRNNMKLALAAALIDRENLLQKAHCSLTILLDESNLQLLDYPIPKSVSYRSVQSQNGYSTIAACGGIDINPFRALERNKHLDSKIDSERTRLVPFAGSEWWE